MFKASNKDTERRHWDGSGVSAVNFDLFHTFS